MMRARKQSWNLRRSLRKTAGGIGLAVVLLVALAGVSLAAPAIPQNDYLWGRLPAAPDAPMGKSTLGDYVWHDANADGDQAGETGINGVVVNLYEDLNQDGIIDPGEPMVTMTTGDNPETTAIETGWYDFDVTADGTYYIVEIAPSNFAPGGALDGYVLTSVDPSPLSVYLPDLIMDYNDADFGYALTSLTVTKDPPLQTLLPGSTATFNVVVTNTGEVILQNIDITDTYPGAVCIPDPIPGPLAPGATATATCTVTNVQAGFVNYVSATATPVDEWGNTLPGDTPSDESGPAEVLIADPAIDVEKYVSIDGGLTWVDADTVTGPYLNSGTAPQFKIVVTNTGNVPLSNVDVTDSVFGTISLDGTLAVGASAEYLITTATWAEGQHTNIATASGDYTDSSNVTTTVQDSDAANYYGSNPEIDVEKYVSIDGGLTWVDADAAPGPTLVAPANPQFKFVVTNTGNVALSNVTVTDSDFAIPVGCVVTSLAVGASDDCIITAAWAAGQHTNTATASGDFTDGNGDTETDSDTDDANYLGVASSIGDYVWWDVDGDGVQDPGEPAIPGVDVTLFSYPTDTTDAGGIYTFENLPAGTYLPTIPAYEFAPGGTLEGFALTTPFLGGNIALDSNGVPDGAGGVQATVNLPTNTANMTIDFGFVKPTSYTLEKTAVTIGPVTPGDPVQFRIRIVNTGSTYISVLPLVDTFDPLYLQFVSASVAPDSVVGGTITWSDLTVSLGDLPPTEPDSFFDVFVNFVALEDTTALPTAGETINTAFIEQDNTRVDPDGPGGIGEATSPVPDQSSSDGIQIIQPTGVTLAGAAVTAGPDGVLVAWETVDESAILGFNVLRDGEIVNAELILAGNSGVPAGAAYSTLDAAAPGAHVYVLEVIGLDGSVQRIALGSVEVAN